MCAPGQARNFEGLCENCPGGKFSPGGQAECKRCARGRYGRQSDTSSDCAGKCATGQFAGSGRTSCTRCHAGRFAKWHGSGHCVVCEPGQYQAGRGKSSCSACATGRHQQHKGKTSCVDCMIGSEMDTMGATVCDVLPPTPQPTPVPTHIPTPVPTPGTVHVGAQPQRLLPLTRLLPIPVHPRSCPAGRFCDVSKGTIKVPFQCIAKVSDGHSWGTAQCSACPHGRFANLFSSEVACIVCAQGKFAAQRGASECVQCKPGKVSLGGTGARACTECDPGKFESVGVHCHSCQGGRYQPQAGSVSCTGCPSGKFSNADVVDFIPSCSPCTCASGTYSRDSRATRCNCVPDDPARLARIHARAKEAAQKVQRAKARALTRQYELIGASGAVIGFLAFCCCRLVMAVRTSARESAGSSSSDWCSAIADFFLGLCDRGFGQKSADIAMRENPYPPSQSKRRGQRSTPTMPQRPVDVHYQPSYQQVAIEDEQVSFANLYAKEPVQSGGIQVAEYSI
jgi:hypothetical protein